MKFSIFAPIQFLNYWILQRGVLGEEFFFWSKISYKIKVQHLSFTSHFQPLINMKYSFEQIHPKNARKWPNLQIHLYRLSSKFGAKKSKIWIFWNKYYNNRKMLRVLKQDPWARSFPILIFSRSFENFWKSRFFILKSLFLDLKMPQLFEDTFFSTRWVPNEEFFWKIKIFKS